MVVMHDDLELIKYFFKQVNGYQLDLENTIDHKNNYYSYFENLELLKHFEGLTLKVPSTSRLGGYLQHYTREKTRFPINFIQSTTINLKTYKLLTTIVLIQRNFKAIRIGPDVFSKDFLNFLDWIFTNYPNMMKIGGRFFN
ncbi:hypothetical protein ACTFIT_000557 [Dictyostelium discoideum]